MTPIILRGFQVYSTTEYRVINERISAILEKIKAKVFLKFLKFDNFWTITYNYLVLLAIETLESQTEETGARTD